MGVVHSGKLGSYPVGDEKHAARDVAREGVGLPPDGGAVDQGALELGQAELSHAGLDVGLAGGRVGVRELAGNPRPGQAPGGFFALLVEQVRRCVTCRGPSGGGAALFRRRLELPFPVGELGAYSPKATLTDHALAEPSGGDCFGDGLAGGALEVADLAPFGVALGREPGGRRRISGLPLALRSALGLRPARRFRLSLGHGSGGARARRLPPG